MAHIACMVRGAYRAYDTCSASFSELSPEVPLMPKNADIYRKIPILADFNHNVLIFAELYRNLPKYGEITLIRFIDSNQDVEFCRSIPKNIDIYRIFAEEYRNDALLANILNIS